MSADVIKMRQPRRCSQCRGRGHNRRNCPEGPIIASSEDLERWPKREELEAIFDAADEMVGAGDPDYFDEEHARIALVKKQLWRVLGWKDSE